MQFLATLKVLVAPSGRAKAPTASTIEKALAEARAEHAAAMAEISTLQASRLLALVDAEQRSKHTAALAAARQRADDAALAAEELQRRLGEAEAEERETGRRRLYDETKRRSNDLSKAFGGRFGKPMDDLAMLMRETAEVDLAIEMVNAALPDGAEPLPDVEAFRGRPGLPRRVLRTEVVDLWASPGGDQPIPDEMQSRVEREKPDRGDGQQWGVIHHVNKAIGHHSASSYVLKRFQRVTYVASAPGETGPRIRDMHLPALHVGEPDVFTPSRFYMAPRTVIAALDEAAAQPVAPPEQDRREKRVEYRLAVEEPPAEPTPSIVDSL